jgi:starch-binding outer membrane protein, SusD/RagB family
MKSKLYFRSVVLVAMCMLINYSCTLDYINPNAPTEASVLSSTSGLINFSLGLRSRYSIGATGGLYNAVTMSGLATKELRVVNAGNADLAALEIGGSNVTNLNSVLNNLWLNLNLLNEDCEKIIDNVDVISDATVAAYVQGHAHLFKSVAISTMAQFWEQVPVISTEFGVNATFVSRAEALDAAALLCEQALSLIGTSPQPAAFTSVLGSSINIVNALNVQLARCHLMAGNYQESIDAANIVISSTALSDFRFDATAQNPLFRSSFVTNNVHQGTQNLGLSGTLIPEAGDGRVLFYLNSNVALPTARGFWTGDAISIPFYLPGEVRLIKAEAHARLNQLPAAIAEVNIIRRKNNDPLLVNANLGTDLSAASNQDEVLTEIYKNRCIELYLTGWRLEDSRRFGRPGPGAATPERNRNFFPYPFVERSNNPLTPADPAN